MTRAHRDDPPLVLAALAFIKDGATTTDLEARFAAHGADLRPGVSKGLLSELASLGLVRVANAVPARKYVLTSLGLQLIESGLSGETAASLRNLERLRTDLLSTMAHELRTPLTVVRTSAGLLLDRASSPSDEQRTAMLETIERNAERMQRLVGDILDLARFRTGAIRLQQRQFDPADVAESVVDTIRPLAEQRGQTIALDITRPIGKVYGDRRRLERALLNLVSNAQRFSPDRACVDVRVAGAHDGSTRWTVTDNGPGISLVDQARLFERFFVGRNDRHGAHEGVGLGLPTALAIAQAHGGTIEVRSRSGEGSTFTLVVPSAGVEDEP
ncbi:MAG: HAMP domain-containing sensor histidine kinase [Chloroflexota bacterium]